MRTQVEGDFDSSPSNMISLIVATLHRVEELERLLVSLDQQTYKNFEVLIVDQNDDARLNPILQSHPNLAIRHLRSGRGLSHGRNVALSLAKGDFICFPDDDCWYPKELLANVLAWFEANPKFGVLFTCVRDADDSQVGPKWPKNACLCTRRNLWFISISPALFVRRLVVDSVGLFKEEIGTGSPGQYQSGEDIDYSLRALELGHQLWFNPSLTVHHPSFHDPGRLRRTTYGYALGGGYVQRIHGYSVFYFASQVIRSLGGAVVSFLKGDTENGRVYLLRATGQVRGFCWGPHDIAHYRALAR